MKKPLIILLAIIIFLLPLMQIQQQTAQAAVTGKVISLAAKKIAKEVATDAAIEVVGNLALKHALPDPDGKYKVDTGKQLICLPGGKKDGVCETPAQLDVTRSKVTIGNAVESELDKAINNGKHFTKWQKFLDWFAPLWAISFGVTFLTYAFDSDVRTMFNEIAMNALYSIGAIQPVSDSTLISDIPFNEIQEPEFNSEIKPDTTLSSTLLENTFDISAYSPTFKQTMGIYGTRTNDTLWNTYTLSIDGQPFITQSRFQTARINKQGFFNGDVKITYKNYQTQQIYTTQNIVENPAATYIVLSNYSNFTQSRFDIPPHSLIILPQLNDSGKYQMDLISYYNNAHISVEFENYYKDNTSINSIYDNRKVNGMTGRVHLFTNKTITEIPLPDIEHISPMVDPLEMTPYVDGSIMTTPSPSTIPFKHSETGEPLHRDEQDPNIWRDPAGDPVPEELIEVGDPEIIKQPDGSHVAVPQPTPSNPTPVPEQITEPLPDTITPEDFEGLSCDTIKKPKFDPLATAVMTSFPFSIPWDIQRIYEALFANVGSERPEFVFKIPGYDQEFPISLNSYFDDWVPFIRSIILLTFDMGLLYAAYRWTKGGSE